MCWQGPGWGMVVVLSFDFLPDLVKVVGGHEPGGSRTGGRGRRGGKCTHSPARKASVTAGHTAGP